MFKLQVVLIIVAFSKVALIFSKKIVGFRQITTIGCLDTWTLGRFSLVVSHDKTNEKN